MDELVRSGKKTPKALARDFEPSGKAIRNWVRQADLDEGRRSDGLTTTEHEEVSRLRRENRTLREEREILKKAAAWFARETTSPHPEIFGFVRENRAVHPVVTLYQVLDVSPSGYYARQSRPRSAAAS